MSKTRQTRRENTKNKILDAAREIIYEKGLDGFSMRLLAEKIDYSPAAIYKYFHNKQEILQAIRDEYWLLVFERRSQLQLDELSPPERLYQIARAYIETAETYPQHYHLMFDISEAPVEKVLEIGADHRIAGMVKIIKDGIESGYFQMPEGYTPELMALQNWITTHGMIMLKLTVMRGSKEEFDLLCDRIIKNSIQSIIRE